MKTDKKRNPICGIYKITNNINGKCYIGQSIDIQRRWYEHKNPYMWETHRYKILYLAFAKYGVENFTFQIIENCERNKLDEREIYWIEQFNSYKKGYNMTKGGQGNCHRKLNSIATLDNKEDFCKELGEYLADIISEYDETFEIVKSFLCPYANSVDEIDDEDIIEEIDGYDTMFRDFCDGYDNFEQWAECNLI